MSFFRIVAGYPNFVAVPCAKLRGWEDGHLGKYESIAPFGDAYRPIMQGMHAFF